MEIKDVLISQQIVTIATQLHIFLDLHCDFNHCFYVSDFINFTLLIGTSLTLMWTEVCSHYLFTDELDSPVAYWLPPRYTGKHFLPLDKPCELASLWVCCVECGYGWENNTKLENNKYYWALMYLMTPLVPQFIVHLG